MNQSPGAHASVRRGYRPFFTPAAAGVFVFETIRTSAGGLGYLDKCDLPDYQASRRRAATTAPEGRQKEVQRIAAMH